MMNKLGSEMEILMTAVENAAIFESTLLLNRQKNVESQEKSDDSETEETEMDQRDVSLKDELNEDEDAGNKDIKPSVSTDPQPDLMEKPSVTPEVISETVENINDKDAGIDKQNTGSETEKPEPANKEDIVQTSVDTEKEKNENEDVKNLEIKEQKDLRDETPKVESNKQIAVSEAEPEKNSSHLQDVKALSKPFVSGSKTFRNIPNPLVIDQEGVVSFRSDVSDRDKFNNLLDMYNASEDLAMKITTEECVPSVTELKTISAEFASQENILISKPLEQPSTSKPVEVKTTPPKKTPLARRLSKLFHKKSKTEILHEPVEKMFDFHLSEDKVPRPDQVDLSKVVPEDIGHCFQRGFRPDCINISGEACLQLTKKKEYLKMKSDDLRGTYIDFSERHTALDFLLALGFSIDEASTAIKDDDVRSRLTAAVTEVPQITHSEQTDARVWINRISTTQGTLLYILSYKIKPGIMRYFLQIVEAIINKRISNAVKLDGFLRVLNSVEEGQVDMITVLGLHKFDDEQNEEKLVKQQLRLLFITLFRISEREAALKKFTLDKNAIALLRILAAKYRSGLHPHLELIARYIGQGLLKTEIQLEAAMVYLSRLNTEEVKLKEFEHYCDITCEEGTE